jgi:hypothetical protein
MRSPLTALVSLLSLGLLLSACSIDPVATPPQVSGALGEPVIDTGRLVPAPWDQGQPPSTAPSGTWLRGSLLPVNTPEEPDDLPAPIDLRAALGVIDAYVVGVTVAPDTGRRYLLDQFAGIFELEDDGSATLVRSPQEFPVPDVLPASLWTDFVAMGEQRFALTALSDGYLLDLGEDTMTEYFCYEPDDEELPWEQLQLTHSVAFDPDLGVLYAQPITFFDGSFDFPLALSSSIGSYSLEGGQPTGWFNIADVDFLARGAAVDSDGTLLLGRDDQLFRFDPENNAAPQLVATLPGVSRIEGLAVDLGRGELLVVDGDLDLLVTLSADL